MFENNRGMPVNNYFMKKLEENSVPIIQRTKSKKYGYENLSLKNILNKQQISYQFPNPLDTKQEHANP